jgi:hypothetical protein
LACGVLFALNRYLLWLVTTITPFTQITRKLHPYWSNISKDQNRGWAERRM